MAGPGYQNVITTDLVDDPMLTANNIKTFKKAYKELYDFAMVRHDRSFACIRCWVAYRNPLLYAERDHALSEEVREIENSCEWSPGACCHGKTHIRWEDEELLSSERAWHVKQKRTRETWLLKNDLHNLEEQLKEQKKAHQGRPLSSLEYFSLNNLSWILKIPSPQSLEKS
jgi:hypothetical protein